MTREKLRQQVEAAVLATSLRAVADEIGISHTAVSDFIATPDKADKKKTVPRIEKWAAGTPVGGRKRAQRGRPTPDQKALGFDAVAAMVRAISADAEIDDAAYRLRLAAVYEEFARALRDLGDSTPPGRDVKP